MPTKSIETKDSKKVRDVKTFTAFFATTGKTIDEDNQMRQRIADKIGAECQEKWINGQTHVKRNESFDYSEGISVTVSCKDIKGALQFINDLLDEEVQKLRFWGIEGVDFQINSEGEFYFTEEQKARRNNKNLLSSYYCAF